MKIIKRIALIILMLAIAVFQFRGLLYRELVTYRSIGLRTSYSATDDRLVEYINAHVEGETHPDIEQIVEHALSMTSSQLNFTAGRNEVDPKRLITSGTAHCVGYASFFTTSCNYLLDKY